MQLHTLCVCDEGEQSVKKEGEKNVATASNRHYLKARTRSFVNASSLLIRSRFIQTNRTEKKGDSFVNLRTN